MCLQTAPDLPAQGNVAQVTNGVNGENAAGPVIQTLTGIVISVPHRNKCITYIPA